MPQFPCAAKGQRQLHPRSLCCLHVFVHRGEDGGSDLPLQQPGRASVSFPRLFITSSECRCAAAAPGDIFSPLQGITAARAREQQEGGRDGEVPQQEALPAFLLQKPFPGRNPAPERPRGHAWV